MWLDAQPDGHGCRMDDFHPRCLPPVALVRPVAVDPTGDRGPTRGQVPGPGWRRTSKGLHVPAGTATTVEQRIAEVVPRLPAGAMVTGWAALRLGGAAYFDGRHHGRDLPVPVLLRHAQRIKSAGVRVERRRRALPEPVEQYDVPCAPLPDALVHELTRAPSALRAAVAVDMALAAGVVDLPSVWGHLDTVPTRTPPTVAWALERGCAQCRSPMESQMQVVWVRDAGFPTPLMNREIRDLAGNLLAVVDLLDPESGTVGEYDGAGHRDRERHRRDEARLDALREVGLETFTLVAGDSRRVWVDRMQRARRRAAWVAEDQRRWRVGSFVPAPPLMPLDEDAAAHDAMMLEHYRRFE